jgi:hypothetical protein
VHLVLKALKVMRVNWVPWVPLVPLGFKVHLVPKDRKAVLAQ